MPSYTVHDEQGREVARVEIRQGGNGDDGCYSWIVGLVIIAVIVGAIVDAIGKAIQSVMDTIRSAIDTARSTTKSVISAVSNAIEPAANVVNSVISNATNNAYELPSSFAAALVACIIFWFVGLLIGVVIGHRCIGFIIFLLALPSVCMLIFALEPYDLLGFIFIIIFALGMFISYLLGAHVRRSLSGR